MLCTHCQADKPTSAFQPVPPARNKRGFDSWCRPCHADRQRSWRRENPEAKARAKRRNRIRSYGITPEAYESMVAVQGGKCAICGTKPRRELDVDHCHSTGKVRGLLCSYCNKALGMFKDNAANLQAAIRYLEGVR